jgi:hypothetical protein
MNTALKFSLLLFAPVLFLLLLPALFLLPSGVLTALLAIADPTVPLTGAASQALWVIGPIAAACGLFLAGRWLYPLTLRGRSRRGGWAVIWAVFTGALFVALWIVVTVVTSVGASDKPAGSFLAWTALLAAALTVLAQTLGIPWLYAVSRLVRELQPSPAADGATRPTVAGDGEKR